MGIAGQAARAEYRRRRAAEWSAFRPSLSLRVRAVVTGGVVAGVLVNWVGLSRLAVPAMVLVAGSLSWLLRFRPSPATLACKRATATKRRTGRLLRRLERDGATVLHELAVPGTNTLVDHLVIGQTGVFVIGSEHDPGSLLARVRSPLGHGRNPPSRALHTIRCQAQAVADTLDAGPEVLVCPILCVNGGPLPRSGGVIGDIRVVPPCALTAALRGAVLFTPEQIGWLSDRAKARFQPATPRPASSARDWVRSAGNDTPPNAMPSRQAAPALPHRAMLREDPVADVRLLFLLPEPLGDAGGRGRAAAVVAAEALLHPGVRQPDGAKLHELLTRQPARRPGELVFPADLTDELEEVGLDWAAAGIDWDGITDALALLGRRGQLDLMRLDDLSDRAVAALTGASGRKRTVVWHDGTSEQLHDPQREDVRRALARGLAWHRPTTMYPTGPTGRQGGQRPSLGGGEDR